MDQDHEDVYQDKEKLEYQDENENENEDKDEETLPLTPLSILHWTTITSSSL